MGTATASALPPRPGPVVGLVVAIDGPVASGKSTVGRAAARRLGLAFLDTGLMYRALTWLALRRGLSAGDGGGDGGAGGCADAEAVVNLAHRFPVEIVGDGGIAIAGYRPGDELHSPAVNRNVSAVSAISGVRRALVGRQRAIAGSSAGGIIMAGRDIGTVVLPDASVKLYIDAAPETRARRRLAQIYPDRGDAEHCRQVPAIDTPAKDRGDAEYCRQAPAIDTPAKGRGDAEHCRQVPAIDTPALGRGDAEYCRQARYDRILADTIRRDGLDSRRADSPLRIPDGAIVINTDYLGFDATVDAVVDAIRAAARSR